jgi:hypothetical protein
LDILNQEGIKSIEMLEMNIKDLNKIILEAEKKDTQY